MRSLASAPRGVTSQIDSFCVQLEGAQKPFFVDVRPQASSSLGECFENVNKYIGDNGGTRVLGWIIWQTGDFLLQAEFHAIHENKNAHFLDVTPYSKVYKQILFLPSEQEYENKRVQSRFCALKDDVRITDFIGALGKLSDVEEICHTPGSQSYFEDGANEAQLDELKNAMDDIEVKIKQFELMVLEGRGRNDLCFCGSGKKLKKCCG